MTVTNTLKVHKFWTIYRPNPDGTMRAIDMVKYGHMGKENLHANEDAVHRLGALQELVPGADANEAIAAAHARWSVIGPAYKAWKEGHEIPVDGTPLAQWPGLGPDQAEAFRTIGIKTVEQFANAGDDLMRRIPIPHIHELKKQAQLYLQSSDKMKVTAELAKRDALIEQQAVQLEDMRQILLSMQAKIDGKATPDDDLSDIADDAPTPRRHRGKAAA